MTGSAPAQRIALVLHDFSSGGSERIAIRLANRWAAAGRDVRILCGSEAGPSRALVDTAVAVRAVAPAIEHGQWSRPRLGRAVARAVDETAPDVVVGPGNFHVPVLRAMIAALPQPRPPVVCKISNPLQKPNRSPWRQAVFAANFALATRGIDRLVAVSPALADEARRLLRRADIACVAQPNVDDDWTPPPPPRARSGTIVCAGRLAPQKDFRLALAAFARLGGDWRLDLLGEGPERAALEKATAALGIADRVHVRGQVPTIAPYLAKADVLLCSSAYEGYPAVLIEGLAAGVPVVTTPCSVAIAEIVVHPSFGRVAARDPAVLSAALRAVAAGPRPEPAALHKLMAQHRIGVSAQAWLDLLDATVGGRRYRTAA